MKFAIEYFLEDVGLEDFDVSLEDSNFDGKFNGFVDIKISHENAPLNIIAIEIEHKSSFSQAKTNIKKLKTWTHNSPRRKCGMLHIFNNHSNISDFNLSDLVRYAKDNERLGSNFYYEFYFYTISDERKKLQSAEDIILSKDFYVRLRTLMLSIGVII